MATGIFANWYDTKTFTATSIQQRRGEDNTFITEGADFSTKTKEFKVDRHNPTGSFFPQASHLWSLGQDCAYISCFPAYKILTSFGNAGFMLWEGGLACKKAFHEKTAKFSDAAKPAFERLKAFGKDAAILAIPLLLRHRQIPILSFNALNSLIYLATASAMVYAAHNPKGMKAQIAKLEDTLYGKPLDDYQVSKLDHKHMGFSILDGSYSLSRLLNMHRIGKSTDKCVDGTTKKFEYVEDKQK